MDSPNTFLRQANVALKYSISFFLSLLFLSIAAVFAHPAISNVNTVDQNSIQQNDGLLIASLEEGDLGKAQAKRMLITGLLILLLILVFAVKIIIRIRNTVKGEDHETTKEQTITTEEPVLQLKKSTHQYETGSEERQGKEKTQSTR